MAYKNSAYVYIDGINRTPNAVMPLKWGDFLDERLDECNLSLRGVKRDNFAPLTPVDIVLTNELYYGVGGKKKVVESNTEVKHFIVAEDSVSEMQIGSGFFNHELYLIEVTKSAECVVCDTLTFTNDLGRSYTDNSSFAEPMWE